MQSTEESDQSPETQGNTRRIGNTCVSINLTFVKSRLGIFEAAIIVRILSWLWYFEIQDSVQHSKAGVDQKPSDLGRWILWRAALFYFYKQLYSPYRGEIVYRSGEDRRSRVSRGLVVSDVILGFKKKLLRYQNR